MRTEKGRLFKCSRQIGSKTLMQKSPNKINWRLKRRMNKPFSLFYIQFMVFRFLELTSIHNEQKHYFQLHSDKIILLNFSLPTNRNRQKDKTVVHKFHVYRPFGLIDCMKLAACPHLHGIYYCLCQRMLFTSFIALFVKLFSIDCRKLNIEEEKVVRMTFVSELDNNAFFNRHR